MGKPLTAFSTPAAGENVLDSLAAHFPTIRVTTRPVIWTYLDTFDWRIHRDGGALAVTASQQGWIEYRASGNVVEVSFRHLMRDE